MSALLALSEVSASYGPIPVLRSVSLSVAEGEVVALLGANGSGKTTTLRVIAGLLSPRGGRVSFAGQAIERLRPDQRVALGIVLVPEGRGLFPGLTVEENLQLGRWTVHDRTAVRRELSRVFDLFPVLRERRRQLAGSLSGGEQQMLALGRALMARPRLLLLDEPSLGLAPLVVRQIFELLAALRDTGITLLIAEQNAYLALSLATRAYVLQNGEVGLAGDTHLLRDNPDVKRLYLGL